MNQKARKTPSAVVMRTATENPGLTPRPPPPSIQETKDALAKVNELLAIAPKLRPTTDLVAARRKLVGPSIILARGILAHGRDHLDISNRVDKWLLVLDARPDYVNDPSTKLDLAIFQDPVFTSGNSNLGGRPQADPSASGSATNAEASPGQMEGRPSTENQANVEQEAEAQQLAEHRRAVREAILRQGSGVVVKERGDKAERQPLSAEVSGERQRDKDGKPQVPPIVHQLDESGEDADGSDDPNVLEEEVVPQQPGHFNFERQEYPGQDVDPECADGLGDEGIGFNKRKVQDEEESPDEGGLDDDAADQQFKRRKLYESPPKVRTLKPSKGDQRKEDEAGTGREVEARGNTGEDTRPNTDNIQTLPEREAALEEARRGKQRESSSTGHQSGGTNVEGKAESGMVVHTNDADTTGDPEEQEDDRRIIVVTGHELYEKPCESCQSRPGQLCYKPLPPPLKPGDGGKPGRARAVRKSNKPRLVCHPCAVRKVKCSLSSVQVKKETEGKSGEGPIEASEASHTKGRGAGSGDDKEDESAERRGVSAQAHGIQFEGSGDARGKVDGDGGDREAKEERKASGGRKRRGKDGKTRGRGKTAGHDSHPAGSADSRAESRISDNEDINMEIDSSLTREKKKAESSSGERETSRPLQHRDVARTREAGEGAERRKGKGPARGSANSEVDGARTTNDENDMEVDAETPSGRTSVNTRSMRGSTANQAPGLSESTLKRVRPAQPGELLEGGIEMAVERLVLEQQDLDSKVSDVHAELRVVGRMQDQLRQRSSVADESLRNLEIECREGNDILSGAVDNLRVKVHGDHGRRLDEIERRVAERHIDAKLLDQVVVNTANVDSRIAVVEQMVNQSPVGAPSTHVSPELQTMLAKLREDIKNDVFELVSDLQRRLETLMVQHFGTLQSSPVMRAASHTSVGMRSDGSAGGESIVPPQSNARPSALANNRLFTTGGHPSRVEPPFARSPSAPSTFSEPSRPGIAVSQGTSQVHQAREVSRNHPQSAGASQGSGNWRSMETHATAPNNQGHTYILPSIDPSPFYGTAPQVYDSDDNRSHTGLSNARAGNQGSTASGTNAAPLPRGSGYFASNQSTSSNRPGTHASEPLRPSDTQYTLRDQSISQRRQNPINMRPGMEHYVAAQQGNENMRGHIGASHSAGSHRQSVPGQAAVPSSGLDVTFYSTATAGTSEDRAASYVSIDGSGENYVEYSMASDGGVPAHMRAGWGDNDSRLTSAATTNPQLSRNGV